MPILDRTLYEMINNLKNQMKASPLYLGGAAGTNGGIGGPPGGFIGTLPQTKVSYDLSELAVNEVPSGVTLLDNLNRIRYRIKQIEDGGVSGNSDLTIQENGTIIASGVTIINFIGADVSTITNGVTVTISGGSTGGCSSSLEIYVEEVIDEYTVDDTSTTTITFSGLSNDYEEIRIVGMGRCRENDPSYYNDSLFVLVNNDSSDSNYLGNDFWHGKSTGDPIEDSLGVDTFTWKWAGNLNNLMSPSGYWTSVEIKFYNPNDSTKFKNYTTHTMCPRYGETGLSYITEEVNTTWENLDQINRIDIATYQNWEDGSYLKILGRKRVSVCLP